jgi:hypothetical protein
MRMRRALLLLLLFAAIIAALAPAGMGRAYDIVLTAFALVVPTIQVSEVRSAATDSDVQPAALVSLHAFRAPPATSSFA